jgi:hypothetical protein
MADKRPLERLLTTDNTREGKEIFSKNTIKSETRRMEAT